MHLAGAIALGLTTIGIVKTARVENIRNRAISHSQIADIPQFSTILVGKYIRFFGTKIVPYRITQSRTPKMHKRIRHAIGANHCIASAIPHRARTMRLTGGSAHSTCGWQTRAEVIKNIALRPANQRNRGFAPIRGFFAQTSHPAFINVFLLWAVCGKLVCIACRYSVFLITRLLRFGIRALYHNVLALGYIFRSVIANPIINISRANRFDSIRAKLARIIRATIFGNSLAFRCKLLPTIRAIGIRIAGFAIIDINLADIIRNAPSASG